MAQVPEAGNVQYALVFSPQQPVLGFHVSSHRKLPTYKAVGQIPTQPMILENAYNQFNAEMVHHYQGSNSQFSSTYRLKEALISMAVFGAGTKYVEGNQASLTALEGFNEALRMILPPEVGFMEISIRTPDVVLVTRTGDFLIDAASGGLMALIELVWQIYMFSLQHAGFVVTIDEPENHLHPAMQRTLMSNLIKIFPQVQFIVATHSPFIVSAVREARVYVLKYEDYSEADKVDGALGHRRRFVASVALDSVNRSGTASQILRDVLGVSTTYPEWVADDINGIIERHRNQPFNEELLSSIRNDLEKSGLSDLYPKVTSALAK